MEKQRMKCVLQTVSPIHVGCDEVYEPFGFVVDEKKKQLIVFETLAFIAGLNQADRKKFSDICRKGNIESILEIYKFLRNRPVNGRFVNTCSGFHAHYEKVLGTPPGRIKNELNNFKIERTSFCASDHRPYIPGSAIKGALRTAYLNMLADKARDYSSDIKKLGQSDRENRERNKPRVKIHKILEEKLLGLDKLPDREKMYKDPFRLVKVSDFIPAGDTKTMIVYVINKKKKISDKEARGPYQILETILPGAHFIGEIVVDTSQRQDAVSFPVELEKLLYSANHFYKKERHRENRELGNIGITISEAPEAEDGTLIRIGRHSGAESVTIKKYRDIKIMLGNRKQTFEDHATTIWLTSEVQKPNRSKSLSPLGWAFFSPLTQEMENQIKAEEDAFQKSRELAIGEEKRKQKEIYLQKQQEHKRISEQKKLAEKRRKAEEKRKAELEAMTPEERVITELSDPKVSENRVIEIYNGLDDFSEENKKDLALALKSYWEAHGKWKKKDCSKKQWNKVRKVKGILGE
ncbi:MAG: type III-A CRISPR-associated RAMP protein Csm5 [Deltaproteobacteria bacterium]|nr:type III-A CRISPR-associated RAMP protein Csm5 [Deltaproteobacteria bacterium]